jgi:hypothetical protein
MIDIIFPDSGKFKSFRTVFLSLPELWFLVCLRSELGSV